MRKMSLDFYSNETTTRLVLLRNLRACRENLLKEKKRVYTTELKAMYDQRLKQNAQATKRAQVELEKACYADMGFR